MIIKVFEEQHLKLADCWWKAYGLHTVPMEAYPKNTFLIFDKEEPILIGSMFLTDAPIVYFDNLVANPETTKDQRQIALKLLYDVLIIRAKSEGKKWWSCHSKIENLKVIAKQFKQNL